MKELPIRKTEVRSYRCPACRVVINQEEKFCQNCGTSAFKQVTLKLDPWFGYVVNQVGFGKSFQPGWHHEDEKLDDYVVATLPGEFTFFGDMILKDKDDDLWLVCYNEEGDYTLDPVGPAEIVTIVKNRLSRLENLVTDTKNALKEVQNHAALFSDRKQQ